MNVLIALGAVIGLAAVAYVLTFAVPTMGWLFGIAIPLAALVTFIAGFIYRVYQWALVPVPFGIATTCGQQESLDFIEPNRLENPPTKLHVLGRMALEVFFFRSLFRNTRVDLRSYKSGDAKLSYHSNEWLWLFGLMFHYSFLIIFIRHFRLFIHSSPVMTVVNMVEGLDGFLQFGVPVFYITDALILAAVTFLFVRRVWNAQLRYISLVADYFPLVLIGGIAATGILMRYWLKVDVAAVKDLMVGLFSFQFALPENLNPIFFAHVFLVSTLIAYFPFSKLMHMGGVFMSPTRNLRANTRAYRHINPWNPKVKTHTYPEWEAHFRDKLKAVGLPLDNEEEPESDEASGKAEEE